MPAPIISAIIMAPIKTRAIAYNRNTMIATMIIRVITAITIAGKNNWILTKVAIKELSKWEVLSILQQIQEQKEYKNVAEITKAAGLVEE